MDYSAAPSAQILGEYGYPCSVTLFVARWSEDDPELIKCDGAI